MKHFLWVVLTYFVATSINRFGVEKFTLGTNAFLIDLKTHVQNEVKTDAKVASDQTPVTDAKPVIEVRYVGNQKQLLINGEWVNR